MRFFLFFSILVLICSKKTAGESKEGFQREMENAKPEAVQMFYKGFEMYNKYFGHGGKKPDPNVDIYEIQRIVKKAYDMDNSLTTAIQLCTFVEWKIEELLEHKKLYEQKFEKIQGPNVDEIQMDLSQKFIRYAKEQGIDKVKKEREDKPEGFDDIEEDNIEDEVLEDLLAESEL